MEVREPQAELPATKYTAATPASVARWRGDGTAINWLKNCSGSQRSIRVGAGATCKVGSQSRIIARGLLWGATVAKHAVPTWLQTETLMETADSTGPQQATLACARANAAVAAGGLPLQQCPHRRHPTGNRDGAGAYCTRPHPRAGPHFSRRCRCPAAPARRSSSPSCHSRVSPSRCPGPVRAPGARPAAVRSDLLVSTAWLAAHLDDTDLVVVHVAGGHGTTRSRRATSRARGRWTR